MLVVPSRQALLSMQLVMHALFSSFLHILNTTGMSQLKIEISTLQFSKNKIIQNYSTVLNRDRFHIKE
jgi:hypothetical protein